MPADTPLTGHEKMLESIGFKEADKETVNVSCGILGAVMIALAISIVIGLDCIKLKQRRTRRRRK